MMPVNYCRITQDFIDDLVGQGRTNSCSLLLGPRSVGKRFILNRVAERNQDRGIPIAVDFLGEGNPLNERQIRSYLAEAVRNATSQEVELGGPGDPILSVIDQVVEDSTDPIMLLVGNIDGVSSTRILQLLEEVRARVEDGRMTAILSGEERLAELVLGDHRSFSFGQRYFVQGAARPDFDRYMKRKIKRLNLEFRCFTEAAKKLYRLSGGNIHLLRPLLVSLLDGVDDPRAIETNEIPNSLDEFKLPGPHGMNLFYHTSRLVESEPECWQNLHCLLRGETLEVTGDVPDYLEIAGAAIRSDNKLHFASTLYEDFAKKFYDARKWGDLYARDGQWRKAFDHYDHLSLEERLRPASVDDRVDVELALNALASAIEAEATRGEDEPQKLTRVKELFSKGCRYLLGFDEITFWCRIQKHWQPMERESDEGLVTKGTRILERSERENPGWEQASGEFGKWACLAILPSIRPDQQDAVIVSNFANQILLSHERRELTKRVLERFVAVYLHAIAVIGVRLRLKARDQHMEITKKVFAALGRSVGNPKEALALASQLLKPLGYKRVLFCLVDATKTRIIGVHDEAATESVDVALMTDFPLSEPEADIQPYVIHTKRSCIVPDASTERLINPKVLREAGLKSLAIVPILKGPSKIGGDNPKDADSANSPVNRDDDIALGTIHVEREDDSTPSRDEVTDLEDFGRHLAVVLEQCEQVNLLHSGLDKMREPVLIVDRLKQIRYVNSPAAQSMSLERVGWYDEPVLLSDDYYTDLRAKTDASFDSKTRVLLEAEKQRAIIHIEPIFDWRKMISGAMLDIRDLSYLRSVLSAFQQVADAHSIDAALSSMVAVSTMLGHSAARLYRFGENTHELIGSESSNESYQTLFSDNRIALPTRGYLGDRESWMSIDERRPIVFQFCPDRLMEKHYTDTGLEVVNVHDSHCPRELKKNPKDIWIDFPLYTSNRIIGKMTLDCGPTFRPEHFELFKILCMMYNNFLEGLERKEELDKARDKWVEEAADRALAIASHNIVSKISALPPLLARYRNQERDPSGLKFVNDDFVETIESLTKTTHRIKERFREISPQFARCDVVQLLRRSLNEKLTTEKWELNSDRDEYAVELDAHLFADVFSEILDNSVGMVELAKLLVSAQIKEVNHFVEICVADNGPGVGVDSKEKIFDNFFSHRPGRPESNGLGLFFARRVIEAHGGTIIEDGKCGEGANFRIRVPAKRKTAHGK